MAKKNPLKSAPKKAAPKKTAKKVETKTVKKDSAKKPKAEIKAVTGSIKSITPVETVSSTAPEKVIPAITSTTIKAPKHLSGKQVFGDKTIYVTFIKDVKKRTDGGGILTPENAELKEMAVTASFMKEYRPQPNGYFIVMEGGKQEYISESDFNEAYQK